MKQFLMIIVVISLVFLSGCTFSEICDAECKKNSDCVSSTPLLTGICNDANGCFAKCSYEISLDKLKDEAKEIPYDDLFRNNEKYVNKPVVYTGEIIQLIGTQDERSLRININKKDNEYRDIWTDTIYVDYIGDTRFLEDDIVKFYGLVDGIITYKAVMGNTIEIPALTVYDMELVTKAGDR